MEKGDREDRCSKYLEDKLGESIAERKLEFYTWKSILGIRDTELFHRITQALEQKELCSSGNEVFYAIRVPGDLPGDYWDVSLIGGSHLKFLEEYSSLYELDHI